jgi:hypothetical protein
VLADGRPADSPRAKAHAGPTATIALHNLVERDQFGDLGRPLPPSLAPLLEQYRKIYLGYEPEDARYLSNHRGHLMFLRPEEHAICTAELIRATTFTARKGELRERIPAKLGRVASTVSLTVSTAIPECWRVVRCVQGCVTSPGAAAGGPPQAGQGASRRRAIHHGHAGIVDSSVSDAESPLSRWRSTSAA